MVSQGRVLRLSRISGCDAIASREPGPWSMNYVALTLHSRDTEKAKLPTAWGTVHVDSTQCRAPGLPTFP